MVAHRVRARLTVCLHAADVPMHRVAERAQQQSERTVEVVAVAAPASEGNPPCRLYRIDRPPLAGRYPQRLIRHPLRLALHDQGQHGDGRRPGLDPESRQVRRTNSGIKLVRGLEHSPLSFRRLRLTAASTVSPQLAWQANGQDPHAAAPYRARHCAGQQCLPWPRLTRSDRYSRMFDRCARNARLRRATTPRRTVTRAAVSPDSSHSVTALAAGAMPSRWTAT